MKINKYFRIATALVLVTFVFSGCNGGKRLSDLTIVQAVGIDMQDNNTRVSMQYLNLDKNTGNMDSLSGNITSVAYGTSNGISSAISSASKVLSQEAFFGQNKLIIFGREYAQNNLVKGLDYLIRSVDSRPDVLLAMSDKKASDIVSCNENDSKVPAEKIYDLLELGERTGLGVSQTVNDLLNLYADPTSDVYLPVLSLNNKTVRCTGLAMFSQEKYVTSLNATQTFGFLFVNNEVEGGAINVASEKFGNIGVEILSSKSTRSAYVSDNLLHFDVKIKLNIVLNEVEKGTTIAIKEQEIKEIEKLVNRYVSYMCTSAVNQCFGSKSDPFKTGKYLSMNSPEHYNALKDIWRDILPDAVINITVDTKLQKVSNNSVRQ